MNESNNWLLRALPTVEAAALQVHLEPVNLESHQSLEEVDERITNLWFPMDCVASLVVDMAGGRPVEIATIGNEGMISPTVVIGAEVATMRTFVQVPGQALRLDALTLVQLLPELPRLDRLIHRYVDGLFFQVAQSAGCNQVHSISERAARWLLMAHDRVNRDEFYLTQEFLSQMLGVRRAGVSEVASELSRAGLIHYQRGHVTVTDRTGLEQASCACYGIIRRHYQDVLSP